MEILSAERLREWKPGEREWIDTFLAEYAGTHTRQAESLNGALQELTGLRAGDLFDIEPEQSL
jgi:hypothetical protein